MARRSFKTSPTSAEGWDAFSGSLIYEPGYSFEDWAEKFLEFEGDRFTFRPYQRRPARDLFNPKIRSLCFRAYSGAGKTVLLAAGFGYAIDEMGLEIGLMYPSEAVAIERLRDKFFPLFENTPRLARMQMRRGLRGDLNLACDKQWYNGGRLQAVGANSPGKIRVLEVDAAYADEIDSIKQDKSDEGDKLALLFKRTRGRRQQFHWATSYPSRKGWSKIDKLFDESDGCRWVMPCHHCREFFEGHTKQLVWTPGKPEGAELICPHCERGINDKQRQRMSLDGGKYRDRWGYDAEDELPEEFNGNRGFHVNCMAHVGDVASWANGYLHEVAAEIESIGKSDNPQKAMRVFVNTMDAESAEDETVGKPDIETAYGRRENYNPYEMLPAGVLVLTAGVDVQKNRLEVEVMGSGQNDESWGCGYRVIPGSPLKTETWNALFAYLDRPRNHPIAGTLSIAAVSVDTAYRPTDVFRAIRARQRRRVYGVKGSLTLGKPIVNPPATISRPRVRQYPVGTHEAKDLIYQRAELRKDKESTVYPRGFMHFPKIDDYGTEAGGDATGYFEMLFMEDAAEKKSPSGEWLPFFECPKGKRNEALDCRVYAMHAERLLNPNYSLIARKMAEKSEKGE